MELVEASEAEIAGSAAGERVVGQHLGGAHKHRCVGVDGRVAGGEANLLCTEQVDKVEELLCDERLDRRRPHGASAVVQRQQNSGNCDQTLARSSRRGKHHVLTGGERQRRFLLVRVQRPAASGCPLSERIEHQRWIAANGWE